MELLGHMARLFSVFYLFSENTSRNRDTQTSQMSHDKISKHHSVAVLIVCLTRHDHHQRTTANV
jgi:hypothetical protein